MINFSRRKINGFSITKSLIVDISDTVNVWYQKAYGTDMLKVTKGKADFYTDQSPYQQNRYQLYAIMQNRKYAVLETAADYVLRGSSAKIFSPDHPVPQ